MAAESSRDLLPGQGEKTEILGEILHQKSGVAVAQAALPKPFKSNLVQWVFLGGSDFRATCHRWGFPKSISGTATPPFSEYASPDQTERRLVSHAPALPEWSSLLRLHASEDRGFPHDQRQMSALPYRPPERILRNSKARGEDRAPDRICHPQSPITRSLAASLHARWFQSSITQKAAKAKVRFCGYPLRNPNQC